MTRHSPIRSHHLEAVSHAPYDAASAQRPRRHPAKLAGSTLVLVDYQNTYTTGVLELEGWEAALDAAAALLARARREGAKVVHVMHDGGEGTPYDIRAEIGGSTRRSPRRRGARRRQEGT